MKQHNKFDNLKIGIIGCGNIAQIQLRYIVKYVKKDAIALCDKNRLRMEYLSKVFGIVNLFTDINKMLIEFQPKVVHILTPPHTHKDIAVLSIKNGCHVFIEKPMCISTKEAEEIVNEAESNDTSVCVDHLRVFDPLIIRVKQLLDSGKFGHIVNIFLAEVDNYLERKKAGLFPKWLNDLPGEIFFDLLPHHLSIIKEFLPYSEVRGVTYQKDKTGNISNIYCLLSSDQGGSSIHLSLNTYPLQNYIVFECSKGQIYVDFRNRIITTKKKSGLPSTIERTLENFWIGNQLIWGATENIFRFLMGKLDTYAGMDNIILNFYDSVANDTKSPVSGEDALFVIRVMEEVFKCIPYDNKLVKMDEEDITTQFQKADILVTGGTGFIGKKLVKKLIDRGYRVRVMTHRNLKKKEIDSYNGNIQFVQGDISDLNDVENACSGVEIVYHLAAATKGNWLYHLDTTVTGTKNIIDCMERAKVKHLVYISTIGVLNASRYPLKGIINEDFSYEENPEKRGYYSNTKLMAEKIVKSYMDNSDTITITIIRPGIVYGPGKNLLLDIGKQIRNLLVVFGSGKRILPLVCVENLVDALVLAGELRIKGIFNVIDDDKITVKEVIDAYKELTGEKFYTVYLPATLLTVSFSVLERMLSIVFKKSPSIAYKVKASTRSVIHSTDRIKNRLGWRSKISFIEGLNSMIDVLSKNS